MAGVNATDNRKMLPIPQGRACLGLRVGKSALIEKLDEIFREKNVQRPINSDAHFLFRSRQFSPVNSAPEKPGGESGKVYAENACDTCAATDRSKLAEGFKAKRRFRRSINARDNISRNNFTFARCMLRDRRTIFACRWIWNERAITERPKPIHPFHLQVRIDFDSPSFFLAWNTIKDRILAVYDSNLKPGARSFSNCSAASHILPCITR